jgi:hypothetical protein
MMGSATVGRQWFWDESGYVEVAPPVSTGFSAHTMSMVTVEAAAVFQFWVMADNAIQME